MIRIYRLAASGFCCYIKCVIAVFKRLGNAVKAGPNGRRVITYRVVSTIRFGCLICYCILNFGNNFASLAKINCYVIFAESKLCAVIVTACVKPFSVWAVAVDDVYFKVVVGFPILNISKESENIVFYIAFCNNLIFKVGSNFRSIGIVFSAVFASRTAGVIISAFSVSCSGAAPVFISGFITVFVSVVRLVNDIVNRRLIRAVIVLIGFGCFIIFLLGIVVFYIIGKIITAWVIAVVSG